MKSIFNSILLIAALSSQLSSANDRVIKRIAGEWIVTSQDALGISILIQPDGRISHSEYGEGYLKHLGGTTYEINFNRADNKCYGSLSGFPDGRLFYMKVRGDGGSSPECPFGILARRIPAEEAADISRPKPLQDPIESSVIK